MNRGDAKMRRFTILTVFTAGALDAAITQKVKVEDRLVAGVPGSDTSTWLSSTFPLLQPPVAIFAARPQSRDPNGKGLAHWPAVAEQAGITMELGDKNAPVPVAGGQAKLAFFEQYFSKPRLPM
jgi:hypothetical protein